MSKIGTRLKELRKKQGLTQDDLAAAVGVGKTTVGRYERGLRTPDAKYLEKLSFIIPFDANWLLRDDGSLWRQKTYSSSPALKIASGLMDRALEAVKSIYAAENARLPSKRAAGKLAAHICSEAAKLCVDDSDGQEQDAALHLAALRLRRALRSADPAMPRKRPALGRVKKTHP